MPEDVQRNASRLAPESAELLSPTIIEPSADTPQARLLKVPPGKSPRPTIPFVVQRNASGQIAQARHPRCLSPAEGLVPGCRLAVAYNGGAISRDRICKTGECAA